MDALIRKESGQALLVAALLLGLAALAVTLIDGAQERLVASAREQRTGEAAVAAAGSAVADLQLARVRAAGRALTLGEIEAFAAGPAVLEAARAAARRIADAHGETRPMDIAVLSFAPEIEVHLSLAGRIHIALIGPPT